MKIGQVYKVVDAPMGRPKRLAVKRGREAPVSFGSARTWSERSDTSDTYDTFRQSRLSLYKRPPASVRACNESF